MPPRASVRGTGTSGSTAAGTGVVRAAKRFVRAMISRAAVTWPVESLTRHLFLEAPGSWRQPETPGARSTRIHDRLENGQNVLIRNATPVGLVVGVAERSRRLRCVGNSAELVALVG